MVRLCHPSSSRSARHVRSPSLRSSYLSNFMHWKVPPPPRILELASTTIAAAHAFSWSDCVRLAITSSSIGRGGVGWVAPGDSGESAVGVTESTIPSVSCIPTVPQRCPRQVSILSVRVCWAEVPRQRRHMGADLSRSLREVRRDESKASKRDIVGAGQQVSRSMGSRRYSQNTFRGLKKLSGYHL